MLQMCRFMILLLINGSLEQIRITMLSSRRLEHPVILLEIPCIIMVAPQEARLQREGTCAKDISTHLIRQISHGQLLDDAPGDAGYRSACSGHGNTVFWVGGSPTSYNYNGVAYDGSGGVDPSARVLHFNNSTYQYSDEIAQPHGVMDLRGIAKLGSDRWIICGGMDTNQLVSNRTFLLESSTVGMSLSQPNMFDIRDLGDRIVIESLSNEKAALIDLQGKEIARYSDSAMFEFYRKDYSPGIFFFIQGNSRIRIRL